MLIVVPRQGSGKSASDKALAPGCKPPQSLAAVSIHQRHQGLGALVPESAMRSPRHSIPATGKKEFARQPDLSAGNSGPLLPLRPRPLSVPPPSPTPQAVKSSGHPAALPAARPQSAAPQTESPRPDAILAIQETNQPPSRETKNSPAAALSAIQAVFPRCNWARRLPSAHPPAKQKTPAPRQWQAASWQAGLQSSPSIPAVSAVALPQAQIAPHPDRAQPGPLAPPPNVPDAVGQSCPQRRPRAARWQPSPPNSPVRPWTSWYRAPSLW